uniref:Coiled-coil and C2 domain-containing protein 1B n=1 Tax=Callorhinchus milii TaxID=7868 RepID=A0A4W3GQU9_CALMI
MQDIERMAALCMKDLDEDEQDEDVDDDEDLLASVVFEMLCSCICFSPGWKVQHLSPAAPAGVESVLTERIDAYKSAINNAKQSGESSKVRRYERGLKTLQTMLTSAKKGKKINEEEIPPPVATGKSSNAVSLSTAPATESPSPLQVSDSPDSAPGGPAAPAPRRGPPLLLPKPTLTVPPPCSEQEAVQSRQREYKLAALHAKRRGDTQLAAQYYQISKKFDPALEALASGAAVDLSKLPPPPGRCLAHFFLSLHVLCVVCSDLAAVCERVPPPPRDVMEALQQRMDKYKSAAAQAKGEGNDRKARMHERIVKQYQDAIRGHKAGRSVNLAELPVPPGFPSIQGLESSGPSLAGMLDNAMQLVNQEVSDAEAEAKVRKTSCRFRCARLAFAERLGALNIGPARPQQQLQFLENRKKQLMKAALRTKQKNDLEGAKLYLRQAKGLDPMIEAAKGGLPVDIKKVPPPPESEEDFVLVQGRGVHIPHKTAEQYAQLVEVLKQQHETCMKYSKQYTHLGNVSETTKFERMAEECKKNIEILKRAHAQGYPLPKYHHEERTFQVVKIFPNLTSSDMILFIVKGINLPAPSGVSPNDLDTFVKFEFAFPNTEEAQKDKTSVMKNTNCPEYNEQFKLTINRGHRGFKRVVHSKGIKFEVVHKGGLFKTDRPVGNAQLKLEKLESQCELREIIEVLDGKKTTGGRMEVMVRIREPLSSQQLERTTEKWLVIDPHSIPAIAVPKAKQRQEPPREVGRR